MYACFPPHVYTYSSQNACTYYSSHLHTYSPLSSYACIVLGSTCIHILSTFVHARIVHYCACTYYPVHVYTYCPLLCMYVLLSTCIHILCPIVHVRITQYMYTHIVHARITQYMYTHLCMHVLPSTCIHILAKKFYSVFFSPTYSYYFIYTHYSSPKRTLRLSFW